MAKVKAVLFGKTGGTIGGKDGMRRMKEDEAREGNRGAKMGHRHGRAAGTGRCDDGSV